MSYQVNPKNQNELKRKIKEKVKEAKDNNQTRTIKHNRQDYELTRIRIDRDWLYYNIQNDRTLTDIEEFIGSNGLSEDYFNEENSFNHEQQTNYHSIISSYVKTQMVKTFQRTLDQRDEIYITHEGLVANGNTRLACFRENDLFKDVYCLVFSSDFGDWDFIREIVDMQDNEIDISTDYPWHARAKRIQKNKASGTDIETIRKRMRYKKTTEVEEKLRMLELAEEFVKKDFPGFSKLSDVSKLGSDEGLQVFTTFAKGRFKKKYDQLDPNIKTKIANICFDIIGTGNKGAYSSIHLAVQNAWSELSIVAQQKQFEAIETPDIISGQSPQTQPPDSDSYEIDPYKDKSDEEKKDYTEKFLGEVYVIQSQKDHETKKDAYKTQLKALLSKLTDINRLLLEPGINIDNLDEILSNFDQEIENARRKIDSLR